MAKARHPSGRRAIGSSAELCQDFLGSLPWMISMSSAGESGVVTGCGSSAASESDSPGVAPTVSASTSESTGTSAAWLPACGADGLGGAGGAAGAVLGEYDVCQLADSPPRSFCTA